MFYEKMFKTIKKEYLIILIYGDGDWGLGIGDWGLGPIPNPQSPIPNPQSPSPYIKSLLYKTSKPFNFYFISKNKSKYII
jgi:hypothetical protein